MKWPTKHPILFLTLVCLGVFFVNLDAIFVNIMEARNFITAREMIQYGHWLLTTINGEPRYQTALAYLAYGLFGFDLWAQKLVGLTPSRGLHGIANGTVYLQIGG